MMIKKDQEVKELKNRVLQLETKAIKHEMIFQGIAETAEEDTLQAVKDFCKEKLKIESDLKILTAFRMGKGTTRPILVRFSTPGIKGVIYSHLKNLKGMKNAKGYGYQISDNLPEEASEKQRRLRQIIVSNNSLPHDHRVQMSLKRGNLKINNVPYRKKVDETVGKDILKAETSELQELQEIQTTIKHSIKEKQSHFIAFAVRVASLEEVRKVYKHMSIKYGDATHIMMAYRLDGYNKAYDEDYIDSGEHGSGRRLLKKLVDAQISSAMIVVVRYYGGFNLGIRHFEIIQELADKAIDSLRDNLSAYSHFKLHQTMDPTGTAKKHAKGRGRGAKNNAFTRYQLQQQQLMQTNTEMPFFRFSAPTIPRARPIGTPLDPSATTNWNDYTDVLTDNNSWAQEVQDEGARESW